MGSWFAENLKKTHTLGIYDKENQKTKSKKGMTVFKELSEIQNFKPEILINAVSIQNTIQAFKTAAHFFTDSCILADVASVKANIPQFYQKCGFRFVSIHPMFGPTFANVDRLENENVILIKESDPEGISFFENFFKSQGLNIFEYSFDEHDQIIAYSLAFPFASTMIFAAHMSSSAVPGTTFKKHLQIAKGLLAEDDYLLAEILFSPYSLSQLEKVTQRLEFLKHIIKDKDFDEARDFFQRLRNNLKK
jgi:prephenate dehydrogenase